MEQTPHHTPFLANLFHEGNTCPSCQEIIQMGQHIVKCDKCGSLQHYSCWDNHKGCASYLCDKKTGHAPGEIQPELRISSYDLQNVVAPPKPQQRSAQEITTAYLPPVPTKISKVMIVGLIITLISFVGLAGLLTNNNKILVLGFVLAVSGAISSAVAMIIIYNGKKFKGLTLCASVVLVAGVLAMVYLAFLDRMESSANKLRFANLKLEESLPQENDLAKLEPAKANAMRANVVIETGQTYDMQYGSGVILKIENNEVLILTNKHVIDHSEQPKIEVTFFNGEKTPAKAIWRARDDIDLAILSCQTYSLDKNIGVTLVPDNLVQGTRVFAVGNPEKLPWSYTEGVISSLRTKKGATDDLIIYQTQTPINFGNSGGGLYDMQGRLAGINTWTQDKSVSEGLNFSIASKSALALWSEEEKKRFQARH